ncbi:hypothetical protein [Tautonia sociabilis]|uniref:Uncharacterized protein n=1 Tax=Tautonia sociabilis TaxID=2080755 RepID=A0A432MNR0_9BACT|nr:hypothetical protein [Tautonia sociabilis]RUL88817.1 hypothetical protein TsocGM_05530 [Tautonia sociabilis]
MRRVSMPWRPGPAGLALALAALASAAGCTRNYYIYGESPAYMVPGETVVLDEVCELPSRVFSTSPAPSVASKGSAVSEAPDDPDVVASSGSRSSRVVISRPSSGPISGNWIARGSRTVTTRTQGSADLSRIE